MFLSRLLGVVGLVVLGNQSLFAELSNTDGYGLAAKPEALSSDASKMAYKKGLQSCSDECVKPFGDMLGSVDGAISYSNCKSTCIKPEYSFLNLTTAEITVHTKDPKDSNLHYIGVIYQCVEYARKWWMLNKGITFDSIDSAYEIIYLTEGKDIRTNEKFPLGRSINGTASRPPQRGDLIIYSADRTNPDWRHGHVAVVVDVDLKKGSVSIAEENYSNQPWQQPKKFSRKIQLFEVSGKYSLIDVDINSNSNPTGAAISGWIYPVLE